MAEKFKFGVISQVTWGPRAEPVDYCASRVREQLKLARELYPDWLNWQHVDKTSSKPVDQNEIHICLLKGLNYYDTIPYPILDLGYSATFIPAKKQYVHWLIRLQCGCFGETSNQCHLTCIDGDSDDVRCANAIDWDQCLQKMNCIWDADSGHVSTDDCRQLRKPDELFRIGWITYVSHRLVPELPSLKEAVVQEIKGNGWMIYVLPEDFPQEFPMMPKECLKRLKTVVDALSIVNRKPNATVRKASRSKKS